MSSNKSGRCIFCGGPGLTKQHVMPRWLSSVVLCDSTEHSQMLTRLDLSAPGQALIQPGLRFEQGDFFSRKIRKVCGKCNSGWMSTLESQAKPHLIAMILGEPLSMSVQAQESVAAWVMMTAIMAEFTDCPMAAIPVDDRQYLATHRRPPSTWRMWLGSYEGERWVRRYRHYGGSAIRRGQPIPALPVVNYQYSTLVIGAMFVQAASSTVPDVLVDFGGRTGELLARLWPLSTDAINWPRGETLTDDDADFVAQVPMQHAIMNSPLPAARDA